MGWGLESFEVVQCEVGEAGLLEGEGEAAGTLG